MMIYAAVSRMLLHSAELGGRGAGVEVLHTWLAPSCNTQPLSSLQVLFPITQVNKLAILFHVNKMFGRSTGECIFYTLEAR